jgi:glycosyltransferase involved in cell wall biosynthesis
MKLVVFAYKPPPHHGQSYMVGQMLEGFGGDQRNGSKGSPFGIECYHVNANFASDIEDLGRFRPGKVLKLVQFVAEALWCRWRYGASNFYYVPAPNLKTPVIRDWVILLLCRPFFRRTIFYWHAAGLGEWLPSQPRWFQRLTHCALDHADLSMAPSRFAIDDAQKFRLQRSAVVPYGVPDPCPHFEKGVRAKREERAKLIREILDRRTRSEEPMIVRVLYMALCTRDKGLIDAVEAVNLANQTAAKKNPGLTFELKVAGTFWTENDRREFEGTIARLRLETVVRHVGFLKGPEKDRAMVEADLFCFPSFYPAESFGLVLVEAMAYGLPIVTTRWRSIPEFFSRDYPGLVNVRAPDQIAAAFFAVLQEDYIEPFRQKATSEFRLETHLRSLAEEMKSLES